QFWNNYKGMDLPYTQQTVLQNIKLIHSLTSLPPTAIGVNAVTSNITYNNLTVTGYVGGVEMPSRGTNAVNGGYFDNQYDFVVVTGAENGRTVVLNGPIGFGSTTGGEQYQVYMRPDYRLFGGSVMYTLTLDRVILNYG